MNNLIGVFMNYKINRLIKYGTFIYSDESDFVKQCFKAYFRTYVDNYYYGIFNTIDSEIYNQKNLALEFKGIKEEMLDEYADYELQVSNREYDKNRKIIFELMDIALEITKIDQLEFKDKDLITSSLNEFITNRAILNDLVGKRIINLASLVRETYNVEKKLLELNDSYFKLEKTKLLGEDSLLYVHLKQDIGLLNNYRKTMVDKIYKEEKLKFKKFLCLVQKISLYLLKGVIENRKIETLFIEIDDIFISRGKIDGDVLKLIDNPIFRKYVVLCVNYNTFINQRKAFGEDYNFGCIQDFSHINDVYAKTENIYKEGIFNYLLVSNCKDKDRDYFQKYENEGMKVLVFEEE